MKARALCCLWIGLVAAACGHPVQRQLEGSWHGDTVENFDDADLARATGWAKSLRMTFNGSNVIVSIAAEEERAGTYRVKSVHNSDVVLAIRAPDGREDTARFKLDDDHVIRWVIGESRSIVMRREM